MRSSIACVKCRRSKVKCLNNGPGTPCRACQTSGRECIYPEPVTDRSHRRETLSHDRPDPNTPDVQKSRSKSKKTINYGLNLQSSRALVDALDAAILTPLVWLDLLQIWERHYAIDLPFLHPPTFQDILRQAKAVPFQDFSTPRQDTLQHLPPLPHEFLLAFLALTSKYQANLVNHHSSRTPNPRAASEYYATACKHRLDRSIGESIDPPTPSLARVQTILMLACYEWGNCEDVNAWERLSQAIREARLLGLTSSASETSIKRSFAINNTSQNQSLDMQQIERETSRRTFWCCFLLERLFSSGLYRPTTLQTLQITVPLPISQPSFLFNRNIKTLLISDAFESAKYIHPNDKKITSLDMLTSQGADTDANTAIESGPMEGVLSRYLKLLDIFNAIVYWASAGGRLNEKHSPWHDRSKWRALYQAIVSFEEGLPRDLSFTPANISAHRSTSSLGAFALLHTVLLLSRILLHREWLPFIPSEITDPRRPIDKASPFLTRNVEDHPSFWDHSAAEMFKSAKTLLDLFTTCIESRILPETPLVAYASFVVAILGLYSTHFPWMDTAEHMSKSDPNSEAPRPTGSLQLFVSREADIARKAAELVIVFKSTLRMADNWFTLLQLTHRHFTKAKKALRREYRHEAFGRPEIGNARSALAAIADSTESHKPLDSLFGSTEDVEMHDVLSWAAVNHTPQTLNGGGINGSNNGQQDTSVAVQSLEGADSSTQPPHNSSTSAAVHAIPQFNPTLPSARYSFGDPTSAIDPSISAGVQQEQAVEGAREYPSTEPGHLKAETVFGAQDLVLFIEGIAVKDFPTIGGWVGVVWKGGSAL